MGHVKDGFLILGLLYVMLGQAAISAAFPAVLVFWLVDSWAPFARGWTDSERSQAFFILWGVIIALLFIGWLDSLIRGRSAVRF